MFVLRTASSRTYSIKRDEFG